MTKNSWIACVVVVLLVCISIFCLSLTAAGIAGFIYSAPTLTWHLPIEPDIVETVVPSPVVVRPSPQAPGLTPTIPTTPDATQGSSATQSIHATSAPVLFPSDTLHTLENTIIPINDPIELAHRLLNMDNLSPTLEPPSSPHKVGDQQTFWAGNGEDQNFQIDATLQVVTPHAYFWIENGVYFRLRDLNRLADSFENQIYPTDRSFFGSEWTPGVDGDPHIYIVYARGIGKDVAGYFSSADEYPPEINRFSNAHEMFLFNADNSPLNDVYTFGVLAHELQHMIHWYQDRNESNWMGEGFSELAVLLNGFYNGGFDALYTSNPDIQLNNWPDDAVESTSPHYGAGFLFLNYFLDRFGEQATQALVANQDNDLYSIDSTLQQTGTTDPLTGKIITADDFFIDWAITNYIMDKHVGDGRYAYTSYDGTPSADPTQSFRHCPMDTINNTVHQYGVDYISFSCRGNSTLHFKGFSQSSLLPADAHSGSYAFWGNKSDESDTTLTRAFDLTNVSGPLVLNYWTWYDIEYGWDYVYLEASTDGEHWQILPTSSGTSYNPQGSSYGWGYTGSSSGNPVPEWISESVDLSQFAGQKLTLRFEYITDSNVTGEGFLLDDISIPQLGYSADFEANDGGWQSAGWARIQNVLPQTYRLALISEGSNTEIQYISLNPDMSADIPFNIGDGVDRVILVVAGTTRFTRQLARYEFSVSQP